jgi:hypothetical protein
MKALINRAKSVVSRIHTEEDGQAMEAALVTVLSVVILVFAYKMMTGGDTSGGGGLMGLIGDLAGKTLGGLGGKIGGMIGL